MNPVKSMIGASSLLAVLFSLSVSTAQAATPDELRKDTNWEEVSTNVFKAELPNGHVMHHMFGVEGMKGALTQLQQQYQVASKSSNSAEADHVRAQIDEIESILAETLGNPLKASQTSGEFTCGFSWSLSTTYEVENFAYFGVTSVATYVPTRSAGGFIAVSTLAQITATGGQTYSDSDFAFHFNAPSTPFMLDAYMSVPTWTGDWYSSASISARSPSCNQFEFLSHEGDI